VERAPPPAAVDLAFLKDSAVPAPGGIASERQGFSRAVKASFVEGHGFSRAAKAHQQEQGFSTWGLLSDPERESVCESRSSPA